MIEEDFDSLSIISFIHPHGYSLPTYPKTIRHCESTTINDMCWSLCILYMAKLHPFLILVSYSFIPIMKKKCNEEFLCSSDTRNHDILLSWVNSAFKVNWGESLKHSRTPACLTDISFVNTKQVESFLIKRLRLVLRLRRRRRFSTVTREPSLYSATSYYIHHYLDFAVKENIVRTLGISYNNIARSFHE